MLTQNEIAKMKYTVQVYISETTGFVVKITDYSFDQLQFAYEKAMEYFDGFQPRPDNGRFQDYVK